jgi:hypothetical protein
MTDGFLKPDTLQLVKPFGMTFWLTTIILLLLMGAAECVARSEFFQAPLTPPKMGSRHYQLGYKLALLDVEVEQYGHIDCIMVGSSMVDVGFDPDSFQKVYQDITGQDIHCFNFGIDASSAASAAALIRILVEDYHPRLLILGTDPRDYAVPSTDRDTAVILDTPWVKYRQGQFSLEGWLLEHSFLYRYRQHLSQLARFNFEDTLWSETNLNFDIRPNGFTPITIVSDYINEPPDPQDDSFEVTYYARIYSNYQMFEENLSALKRIIDHNESGTQVIVVEMPVADGLYYFFGNGEADYNKFVASISDMTSLHNIPFWRTEPIDSIPDDGWSDYSHLNVSGAAIFSAWLGEQVGRLDVQKGAGGLQP